MLPPLPALVGPIDDKALPIPPHPQTQLAPRRTAERTRIEPRRWTPPRDAPSPTPRPTSHASAHALAQSTRNCRRQDRRRIHALNANQLRPLAPNVRTHLAIGLAQLTRQRATSRNPSRPAVPAKVADTLAPSFLRYRLTVGECLVWSNRHHAGPRRRRRECSVINRLRFCHVRSGQRHAPRKPPTTCETTTPRRSPCAQLCRAACGALAFITTTPAPLGALAFLRGCRPLAAPLWSVRLADRRTLI